MSKVPAALDVEYEFSNTPRALAPTPPWLSYLPSSHHCSLAPLFFPVEPTVGIICIDWSQIHLCSSSTQDLCFCLEVDSCFQCFQDEVLTVRFLVSFPPFSPTPPRPSGHFHSKPSTPIFWCSSNTSPKFSPLLQLFSQAHFFCPLLVLFSVLMQIILPLTEPL